MTGENLKTTVYCVIEYDNRLKSININILTPHRQTFKTSCEVATEVFPVLTSVPTLLEFQGEPYLPWNGIGKIETTKSCSFHE